MKSNKLKAARVMTGLTQTQLAKKLGKNQSWVSDIENDGIGEAKLIDIIRLCKILGIEIKDVADMVSV